MSQMGFGVLECNLGFDGKASFSKTLATYPCKFLPVKHSPSSHRHCLTAFLVSYGGGLVSGDTINISIDIGANVSLCLLTQSSTKVYKRKTASNSLPSVADVHQYLDFNIGLNSLLALLPEPVTCFAESDYHQQQTFTMDPLGSLILLDWFTSGRASRGESWKFQRYSSRNVVKFKDGDAIVRDSLLLDSLKTDSEERSELKDTKPAYFHRVNPYHCFATLIFIGPKVLEFAKDALSAFEEIKVGGSRNDRSAKSDAVPILWSVSPIYEDFKDLRESQLIGSVLKASAFETDAMRSFLSERL
ncbi:hypothetical protein HK096_005900, partial [Nowakowskiella sp. JEL0078]